MKKMFDLHTHTIFSDGVLIAAESARRAEKNGYSGMAFTDHADDSNLLFILENLLRFKDRFNSESENFKVLAGAELTHVRPSSIGRLVEEARRFGADIVIVHGETLTEPVAEGTNKAAIEAGADILAHPGLISHELARLAAEKGVHLEITTRKGHSLSNGHVAKTALSAGAALVINNDFHAPGDAVSIETAEKILLGAGLDNVQALEVFENNKKLFLKKLGG
jgi:histidinol phosphatase-like PHP family hydrolase